VKAGTFIANPRRRTSYMNEIERTELKFWILLTGSRLRHGLETYQRLVLVSSRSREVSVSVSSRSRAFTSRAHPWRLIVWKSSWVFICHTF